ncbi:hypothetical protein RZS08_24240, partial [Arthrospira platensis SPKY1]|nr:hypothetical protein [Arthrospira platensis SPKY1]
DQRAAQEEPHHRRAAHAELWIVGIGIPQQQEDAQQRQSHAHLPAAPDEPALLAVAARAQRFQRRDARGLPGRN